MWFILTVSLSEPKVMQRQTSGHVSEGVSRWRRPILDKAAPFRVLAPWNTEGEVGGAQAFVPFCFLTVASM